VSTPCRGPLRAALGGLRLDRPGRTVVALAARPALWAIAVRMVLRSAAPGWWYRRPPTPAPPPDYLAFRAETMLGGGGSGRLAPNEVVAYLRWCRRMRAIGG
jgi:hypothetical protein